MSAIAAIAEALRDPALKNAEMIGIECEQAEWRALVRANRAMLAALRKIKRIREREDEAGEIARDALRKVGTP